MEIKINISEDCEICKEGLKYFKSLHKQHKGVYMNMDMKTYKLIDGLCLIPDFNCSGHLTHFHLERLSKESLRRLLERIETSEIESKKILEAKKEGGLKW